MLAATLRRTLSSTMAKKLTLYYFPSCPSCVPVVMAAKELDIQLDMVHVDLWKKEHLTLDYVKLNAQHSVPLLDDNGFKLSESRAILSYLVNKYRPGHSVYPSEPEKRAVVDKMLYFDIGSLYFSMITTFYPKMSQGKDPNPERMIVFEERLSILNKFLEGNQYLTGDKICLADFTSFGTLFAPILFDFDFSPYPNVVRWIESFKQKPYYKECVEDPMITAKDHFENITSKLSQE